MPFSVHPHRSAILGPFRNDVIARVARNSGKEDWKVTTRGRLFPRWRTQQPDRLSHCPSPRNVSSTRFWNHWGRWNTLSITNIVNGTYNFIVDLVGAGYKKQNVLLTTSESITDIRQCTDECTIKIEQLNVFITLGVIQFILRWNSLPSRRVLWAVRPSP